MGKENLEKSIINFCLIILPLIFLPNQGVFDYYYFIRHLILLVCFLSLLINFILKISRHKHKIKFDRITISLLVFLFLVTISVILADNPYLAFAGDTIKYDGYITMLIYAVLFLTAKSTKLDLSRTYYGMMITATIISIYGIMQYFGFDLFSVEYARFPNVPYSTIGNQNFLGSYLVLMIPFPIYYWIEKKKVLGIISYSFILFCLLATMSRGPWLGALVGITSLLVLLKFTKRILWKEIVVFATVSLSIVILFSLTSEKSFVARFLLIFFDFKLIIENPENVSAGSFRWFIWSKVIELIKERPFFGFGISNLGYAFDARYHDDVIKVFKMNMFIDEAHNEFLDIAVSCGVPSMFAYIYFIKQAVLSKIDRGFGAIPIYHTILLSSTVGYITQSFFNISIVSVAFIFWTFLGILNNRDT